MKRFLLLPLLLLGCSSSAEEPTLTEPCTAASVLVGVCEDPCPPIVCPEGFEVFEDGMYCDCHADPKKAQHCCIGKDGG